MPSYSPTDNISLRRTNSEKNGKTSARNKMLTRQKSKIFERLILSYRIK